MLQFVIHKQDDMKKPQPRCMMIYRCEACKMDSGFTENEKPFCRYCDDKTEMKLISNKEITPEVMAQRLKELSDRMFSSILSVFEGMSEEDKAAFPEDEDPEKMMLELLAKAKKFKEDIQKIKLKKPEKEKGNSILKTAKSEVNSRCFTTGLLSAS